MTLSFDLQKKPLLQYGAGAFFIHKLISGTTGQRVICSAFPSKVEYPVYGDYRPL